MIYMNHICNVAYSCRWYTRIPFLMIQDNCTLCPFNVYSIVSVNLHFIKLFKTVKVILHFTHDVIICIHYFWGIHSFYFTSFIPENLFSRLTLCILPFGLLSCWEFKDFLMVNIMLQNNYTLFEIVRWSCNIWKFTIVVFWNLCLLCSSCKLEIIYELY